MAAASQVLVPMVSPTRDQWQGSPGHTGSDTGALSTNHRPARGPPGELALIGELTMHW